MRCLGLHRERPRDQKTRQASANQLPEILPVQVPARLQDTQGVTRAALTSSYHGTSRRISKNKTGYEAFASHVTRL